MPSEAVDPILAEEVASPVQRGPQGKFAWGPPFEIRDDGRHRRRPKPNEPMRLNVFAVNKISEKGAKLTHGY
jgi:hypothetical protein